MYDNNHSAQLNDYLVSKQVPTMRNMARRMISPTTPTPSPLQPWPPPRISRLPVLHKVKKQLFNNFIQISKTQA